MRGALTHIVRSGFARSIPGWSRSSGRVPRDQRRHRVRDLVIVVGVGGMLLATGASAGWAVPTPDGAAPAGGAAAGGAAPANTLGRFGPYLVDAAHRVVVVRGVSLPAGVTPTDADLATWLGQGFTGVRLAVPVATGGRVPAVAGWPRPTASEQVTSPADAGLGQVVTLTRRLTDRGLRVVVRLVPTVAGRRLSDATLSVGLAALADRLRAEPGVFGYEVPAGTGPALSDTVAAHDPVHLLWRSGPARFDPAVTVALNDPTGYLTGWKDASPETIDTLVATADSFGLSWFYDPPDGRGATVGTAAPVGVGSGSAPTMPATPARLVRPYPAAVAGTPELLRYDAAGVLTLGLRPVAVALPDGSTAGVLTAGTATAINVPAAAYPRGYQVAVTGGRVTSAADSGLLCVVAEPGAARVEIQVRPATAGPRVRSVTIAGATGCDTGGAPVAGGPAAASATGGTSSGTSGSAARAVAGAASESKQKPYSGPLLWVLPLVGAAAAAGLLAAVTRPWRRRPGPAVPTWSGRD